MKKLNNILKISWGVLIVFMLTMCLFKHVELENYGLFLVLITSMWTTSKILSESVEGSINLFDKE